MIPSNRRTWFPGLPFKKSIKTDESTHSTPRAEARGRASQSRSWQGRGMLRVNTERRFYPDLKIGVWRRRTYQPESWFARSLVIVILGEFDLTPDFAEVEP